MSAILELPEVRERVSPLSVEEYHRLGEYNERGKRTELIRGILIEKMSKSPLHSTIVSLLYRLFLDRLPVGFTARQEQPLTFADSEPEPDISVTRGEARDFLEDAPDHRRVGHRSRRLQPDARSRKCFALCGSWSEGILDRARTRTAGGSVPPARKRALPGDASGRWERDPRMFQHPGRAHPGG